MLELILWAHIAAGIASIPLGTIAVSARKGGWIHARAGTGFFGSMLLLGITAAILEPFRMPQPGSAIPPLLVCYFVVTSWVAARRRDGSAGKFEIIACTVALGAAAVIAWSGFVGGASTPVGRGPIFIFAGVCLLAGLLDLNAILRSPLSGKQRIARHLWRMCVAFFIATGSFFLGQQDVLPAAMRGSQVLFVLAFAPIVVMLFWLVRLRFAKAVARLNRAIAVRALSLSMLLIAAPALADSWAAPQVREVFSASRDHFARITPGTSLGESVGFAGSPKGAPASAEFYRRQPDRSYRLTATAALLNPVAPVDFFVSDAGQLATIDNWHNVGYGRVVALYDAHGKPVQSYALEDLFTAAEIAAFGHSVSSRAWHQGPVYINRDQRTLYLMVASGRDLVLGLETGRFAACETRNDKPLCRTTNADRRWLPYTAAVPDR